MAGGLYELVYYRLSMYFQETKRIFNQNNQRDFPGMVKVVDQMKYDLTSLRKLFDHATPPKRVVQVKDVCTTQYGFGDESGSGFGALWEDQGGENKYWKLTWVNNMYRDSVNLC